MTGYEALRTSAAWIDVSSRGKLRVTGEDRARLLHAMSTNDVGSLATGAGLYAFFLNDKGRILGDAYIYNLGESLVLDTEPETAGKLRDHLDRYIIADDAEVQDETARWTAVEIAGPNAIASAERANVPAPASRYGVLGYSRGFAARITSVGAEGVRVFLPQEKKDEFTAQLRAAGIPNATSEEARIVRLENGAPRYGEEISERYLVQETNQMHAIHSNKGCYLGQEIVERVRSRGQVHRVLLPIRLEGSEAPPAGAKLMAGDKVAAEISSAAYSPALGEVRALAYVRTEAAEAKPGLVVAGSEPPQRGWIVNF